MSTFQLSGIRVRIYTYEIGIQVTNVFLLNTLIIHFGTTSLQSLMLNGSWGDMLQYYRRQSPHFLRAVSGPGASTDYATSL